jgi:hypothetical protein
VYKNPLDYPNKYVARVFVGVEPTDQVVVEDTYEAIMKHKPEHMFTMDRSPNDHPSVLEVWI